MPKYAEILATGDEIRTGALVDSNSAWIAEKLEETGISVIRHSCIGDDLGQLISMFQEISQRSDLAVVTGGLGPTSDDLTTQAAAEALGCKTVLFPEALAAVEAFFQKRNRSMPDSNRKQAWLPQGASLIANPTGTAPGFSLKIKDCLFFFLPGVPREMKTMCRTSVFPAVRTFLGAEQKTMKTRTLSTFGLTESQAADHLQDFHGLFPEIKLGYRALFPEIQIKLYLNGSDKTQIDALENRALDWLRDKLGRNLVSDTGASLSLTIGQLLKEHRLTLALAESCTGGLLAHWLTTQPGSSDYFLFSAVTYSNHSKQQVLEVPARIIEEYGAVSEETALAMARGARVLAGSDYSLSITGIAGPEGGTPEKPVGTVCFGLAGPALQIAKTRHFPFQNRSMNQVMSAAVSLNLLRQHLLHNPS